MVQPLLLAQRVQKLIDKQIDQHAIQAMDDEIGQLEGKWDETAEVMIQRKAQLTDRPAELARSAARPGPPERLKGNIVQPDPRIKHNVRMIIKKEQAVKTGPIDQKCNQNGHQQPRASGNQFFHFPVT